MKEWIKKLYQFKISFVYFFNLGYGEFATPIAVVRDIGIVLVAIKVLFKVGFGWKTDILICIVCFLIFYLIGRILVATNMTQFANKLSNKYNPEISLLNKIAEKMEIK